MSTLGNLVVKVVGDNSQFNKTIAQTQKELNKSMRGLQTVARSMTTVGDSMVKGITLPIIAMGAALLKIGNDFDDAYDKIRVGTGKTGKELEGLKADFKEVAKIAPSSFGDISTAISEVNTRLGLTGKPLQDLSTQILNLSRITKTDLNSNIQNVTRTFGDWSISTDKQSKSLDYMYKVSQSTGIGVDRLGTLIVQYGAPLRQMGFDFETAATMLGKFEKEGVNTELVMGSLRIALTRMAKEGIEDPAEALQIMIQRIKEAGTAGEANTLALEMFGARAGPDMAAAIREGRLDLDDFLKKLKDSPETINAAAKATEDFKEKLILLRNNISLALEPLATKVFDAIGRGVDKVTPKVEELAKWFGNLTPTMQDNFIKWGLIAAIIPVVISGLGRATTGVIKFRTAILTMTAAIKASAFLMGTVTTAAMYGMAEGTDRLANKVDHLYQPLIRLIYPLSEVVHGIKLNIEVIKGLKDGTITWIDLLKMNRVRVEEWADAHREGTEAIEEQIPAIDKAKQSIDEYKQSLIDQGYTEKEATKEAKIHAEMMGYVADEQGELTEAQEENIEVTEEQTKSIDELISSLYQLYNLNQSVTEATWDYEDSLAELDKVMKDTNSTERDKQKAIFDTQDKLENLQIAMAKELMDTDTSIERKKELQNQYIKTGLEAINTGAVSSEAFSEMAKQFGLSSADIIKFADDMGLKLDWETRARLAEINVSGPGAEELNAIENDLNYLARDRTMNISIKQTTPSGGYYKEGGLVGFSQGGLVDKFLSASQGIMIPKFDTGGVLAMLHPPEIVLNAKEAMQLVWNMANRPIDTKGAKGGVNYEVNITTPKPLSESEIKREIDMLSRELGYRAGV